MRGGPSLGTCAANTILNRDGPKLSLMMARTASCLECTRCGFGLREETVPKNVLAKFRGGTGQGLDPIFPFILWVNGFVCVDTSYEVQPGFGSGNNWFAMDDETLATL